VRAHTGRKMRAQKKTWSAQKIIFQKMFLHIGPTRQCAKTFFEK